MNDFTKAMEKAGPSVTPDMEKWYLQVAQQFHKPVRPTTPIA